MMLYDIVVIIIKGPWPRSNSLVKFM